MEKSKTIQDYVVFMTAYRVNKYKKSKFFNFKKSKTTTEILKQFHIYSIATESTILTQNGILDYKKNVDPYKQVTNFNFEIKQKDKTLDDYKEDIDNITWIFNMSHSLEFILNNRFFKIPFYITMEQFLVTINNRVLKVDPVAFFMNDMLFINYQLIDYKTGSPLKKEDIYGNNNYNILQTEKIYYFSEKIYKNRIDNISNIIFYNISNCLEKLSNYKLDHNNTSFLHNLFVVTDKIENLEQFFLDVLGVTELELDLKNINNNNAFKYFSQEYLGVATEIESNYLQQSLFDCLLLEVMKMYFMLKQIINFDITNELDTTIDKQLELERLSYLTKVPIITLNAIENMKKTNSFKFYEKAIKFKISYLKIYQEKRKNKNSLMLNILLYILSFMSAISIIPIIKSIFDLSEKKSFMVLSVTFIFLGVLWVKSEMKK